MRLQPFILSLFTITFACTMVSEGASNRKADLNDLVLKSIKKMPKGGKYSVNRTAAYGLRRSMTYDGKQLVVNAKHATPSFCSSATYLVFLYTIKEAEKRKLLKLTRSTARVLIARGESDGVGIWGRWNANGPGTAQLFQELGIGRNFESFEHAKPGDFMKIFWTNHIGSKERGHSVIYLGTEKKKGVEWVTFWSSNQNVGYSKKSVLKSKIKWAIFSRLENVQHINYAPKLKSKNNFLSSMLRTSSSQSEVRKKVTMTGPKIPWDNNSK